MATGFIIEAEVQRGRRGWQTMYYCERGDGWCLDKERAKVYQHVGWANARRDCLARGLVTWIRRPRVCKVKVNA
jgi:hypothetical protein